MLKKNDKKLQSKIFFTFIFENRKDIFFLIFNKKSNIWLQFWKNDCSQLSFEVYKVFVAEKLQILEFLNEFFFAWILANSATSQSQKFNLININKVSNFSWRCQLSYETVWSWPVIAIVRLNNLCIAIPFLYFPQAKFMCFRHKEQYTLSLATS